MSWLEKILSEFSEAEGVPSNGKQQIVTELLNLIEQSKEKHLPLTWLTGEIKKL